VPPRDWRAPPQAAPCGSAGDDDQSSGQSEDSAPSGTFVSARWVTPFQTPGSAPGVFVFSAQRRSLGQLPQRMGGRAGGRSLRAPFEWSRQSFTTPATGVHNAFTILCHIECGMRQRGGDGGMKGMSGEEPKVHGRQGTNPLAVVRRHDSPQGLGRAMVAGLVFGLLMALWVLLWIPSVSIP
jgi:hypothetical protein